MTLNRHLLPDELDLLLDGETGFGVQQLNDHLRSCEACRTELEGLRLFVSDVERLPELAPRVGFADRVMYEVHVFEPWHVALRDTVAGVMPQHTGGRVLAGAALAGGTALVTAGAAWGWAHRDTTVFLGGLFGDQVRNGVVNSAANAVQTLTGPLAGTDVVGLPLLAVAGGTLLVSAGLGVLGLRAVAARARRLES
jgi:hypothetical protein